VVEKGRVGPGELMVIDTRSGAFCTPPKPMMT
jgi:hypothetical protein